jgi:hypothetical protein
MSYGSQLNIFRAKSNQYGPDWNAIICVDNANELHVAVGDAREALHGTYNRATQTLRVPTGAEMRFRIINGYQDAERAFCGCEFTQIAFVHRPKDIPQSSNWRGHGCARVLYPAKNCGTSTVAFTRGNYAGALLGGDRTGAAMRHSMAAVRHIRGRH